MRRYYSFFLALFIAFIGWQLAQAQSNYPAWDDLYVNDLAQVINDTHKSQIRALLSDVYRTTDVEVTVLTINTISAYETGATTIETFATDLFNEWGIGDQERNDGILLLVAIEDRQMRIELGSGYGPADEDGLASITDQIIAPYFRQENYSLGIYQGAIAIAKRVRDAHALPSSINSGMTTSNPRHATSSSTSQTVYVTIAASKNGGNSLWLTLLGTLGVAGGSAAGLSRYRRYRRRSCPACHTANMVRLGEVEDNAFLGEGQRTEEQIGSVDYDVWQCPNCQHYEISSYVAWFSRYKPCHDCGHRAMDVKTEIVSQPTYHSTGLRVTRYRCLHCSYHSESESVIPMLVETQDDSNNTTSLFGSGGSSHDSFGGGHSSGGGHTGSW